MLATKPTDGFQSDWAPDGRTVPGAWVPSGSTTARWTSTSFAAKTRSQATR